MPPPRPVAVASPLNSTTAQVLRRRLPSGLLGLPRGAGPLGPRQRRGTRSPWGSPRPAAVTHGGHQQSPLQAWPSGRRCAPERDKPVVGSRDGPPCAPCAQGCRMPGAEHRTGWRPASELGKPPALYAPPRSQATLTHDDPPSQEGSPSSLSPR